MKKLYYRMCEIVLGVIFLGAGLNGYLVLFGYEPIFPTSPEAMEFLGTGYLLALEKSIEVVCGILLLIRRYIPLALLPITALTVNILAFHLFIDHSLLPLALLLTVLNVSLLWGYRSNYRGLFTKQDLPA